MSLLYVFAGTFAVALVCQRVLWGFRHTRAVRAFYEFNASDDGRQIIVAAIIGIMLIAIGYFEPRLLH